MRVLRWIPFLFIFLGLTILAEVGHVSRLFVSRFGVDAWENLHFYGSTVLVIAAYFAQPRRYRWWHRLLVALLLVLSAGLLREIRQAYFHGPQAFSQRDMRANIEGAAVGSLLSLIWTGWRSRSKQSKQ